MRFHVFIGVILLAGPAMPQRSPFTGHSVLPPDSTGGYRLLFGGHFHGASTSQSGYPAATLLANIDTINALRPNALFSTGDLFLNADADHQRYDRSLFSKLSVSLFNAPGNHDLEGRHYVASYGLTYGAVPLGSDLILWLDTERDNGNIQGDQLAFLQEALADFTGRYLFIVAHRPLWAEADPNYGPLFQGNTRSLLPTNYLQVVFPIIKQVAKDAQVYWVSGSMAGRAPSSIFFQQHAPNITYIQTAIRDVPRDALLLADVDDEGIRWQGISLTGQPLKAVGSYDAAWWQSSMAGQEPFNLRLIPLYIRQTLASSRFWYGSITTLFVLVILRRVLRRWL